jgi:hypothetical protein
LQQLKNEISIQKEIEPKFQRLFHFGRELINSRRSLSTLGIGKFNSYVLHLHSSQPKDHIFKPTATREKSGTKVDKVGGVVCIDSATTASNDIISSLSNRKRKRNRNQETIDLSCTSATSSSSSTISSKDNNNNGRSLQRNRNINATSASARSSTKTTTSRSNNVQVVVDLLNDSDDDDDDDGDGDGDDEIEVVEVKATSSNKRSSR